MTRIPAPKGGQARYFNPDQAPDTRPGLYYVSATEGRRYSLLLGPYPTHAEALEQVDVARLECIARDPRAVWWAYGTCRLPPDHPEPPRGHLHAHLAVASQGEPA